MARTYPKGRSKSPKRPNSGRPIRLPAKPKKRGSGGGLRHKILHVLGIVLLCAFVGGIAFAVGGYLGLVKSVSQLDKPTTADTHPTYIYSAPIGGGDGGRRVIGTIFQGQNRRAASLEEMPPGLLNALVAKEDERFREHGGVDLWGIMRALWVDFREGKKVEGASTITQQYVKNAYLTQDQTWKRKIKEALIAVEIERSTYENKDQILADYLNTVYYGSNAYGVEAAAETYFNKSVEDLTTAESATLIGILWSPSTLGSDRAGAKEQRDLVLKKMFNAGYITNQDYNAALDEKLPDKWPVSPMVNSGLTGPQLTRNFTELVEDELIDKYGANTVLNGGLSVYTTLDLEDQVAAQDVIYGPTGYLANPDSPDSALVSIEPGTGYIKAMVGNRDQSSHFNLITQAQRQPGSSFKPFALIAALEQGIDPKTHFISEKKVYQLPNGNGGTEKWKVENFGKKERGSITLEDALWQSDNTVFTDLAMNANGKGLKNGPEQIVDVAKRLGISADFPKHPHPSVVLGTREVSPMDMATAYATIANRGRRVEPTAIAKVVKDEGQKDEKVLYKADTNPKGKQVIDPKIASEATEIMMGDITNGIAGKAALTDRPVAGKTGTSENFFDAWFVGFTPQLATGVWMGYAEGGATLEELLDPLKGSLYGTVGSPTEIWHDYMEQAMDGKPVENFKGVDSSTAANTVSNLSDPSATAPATADPPVTPGVDGTYPPDP